MQRILGTTSLSGNQWLLCIAFAFALLLVDEVIKFFMRRSRSQGEPSVAVAAPAPAQA
jgi:Ca2+-transporting ATPase